MKRCLNCDALFDSDSWLCPECNYHPVRHRGFICFAPQLLDLGDDFSPEFFAELAPMEGGNFWFKARNELILYAFRRFAKEATSFLEIGAGTGYVLSGVDREFPELELTAGELLLEGLSFIGSRVPTAMLYQIDARSIPFERQFDVIGAFDVIEHISDDTVVLRQILRALKPGGLMFITVPQHNFLWSPIDQMSGHKRRYSRRELLCKIREAGFSPVWATSFVVLLFPGLLFSRALKSARGEQDWQTEFKIGRFVNFVFTQVMAIERSLIQAGMRFSFGGSLLLVARRI